MPDMPITRSSSMRLPDTQRLSDAAGATAAEKLAQTAPSPSSPGPGGAAPVAATLPPETLTATDEQLEAPGSTSETAAQIQSSHEEASQLDEPPAQQGFFKGLMSKALSVIKGNSDAVLTVGVMLGITLGIGGAAALWPALVGLAIGAAVVGAAQTVKPHPEPEDEKDKVESSNTQAEMTPQRHEEMMRQRELDRQLEAATAKRDAQKAAELQNKSAQSHASSDGVDLLGLHEPAQEADLLGLEDPASSVSTKQLNPYEEALRGVFDDGPSDPAALNDADRLANAAAEVIKELGLDSKDQPLIDLGPAPGSSSADQAKASKEFQELFGEVPKKQQP